MAELFRLVFRAALAAGFFAAIGSGMGVAQDKYPSQHIRIVVGSAPGGNTDIPARLFAAEMSKILGVPVVVENRPGASGVPAAQAVSRATPDGHTLLWGTSAGHSVAVVTMAPLPYHPVKDFAPITLISQDPNIVIAAPDVQEDSIQSLLASIKSRNDTLMATSGPATTGRFAIEMMKAKLGLKITVVPYKSAGPMLSDITASHVALGILAGSTAIPLIRDKRIKAFAVTGLTRSIAVRDLPTLDETISPGFEAVAWSALFAPPATPQPIVARLNATMRQIAEMPEIQKWMNESGLSVPMATPEQLSEFMRKDIARWVQLAKENNIKVSE